MMINAIKQAIGKVREAIGFVLHGVDDRCGCGHREHQHGYGHVTPCVPPTCEFRVDICGARIKRVNAAGELHECRCSCNGFQVAR